MKGLVWVINDLHRKFRNFESASDKELKFSMLLLKHLEKVYLVQVAQRR